MGKLTTTILKQRGQEAKRNQEKKPLKLKRKLRPIFFTFDTLDCGRVNKEKTSMYRTTSF